MKSLLTTEELIKHMQEKGIKFSITSTEEAASFLQNNNYYFKLAAYRSLYPEIQQQSGEVRYQNLEFAYLQELSTIDMYIRYKIMDMCLDIEHAIKVKLITSVTNNRAEDRYEIVRRYLAKEDPKLTILKEVNRHKSSDYCRDLIAKNYPYFPVWALVELITFGELLHLCDFYESEYQCQIIPANKFMNTVRDLRNAAAHSNCLLNQLNQRMAPTKQPDERIVRFIMELDAVGSRARRKNQSQIFSYDILTLLYVYDALMPVGSKKKKFRELKEFMNGRVARNKAYFAGNNQIKSVYSFFSRIIDKLSIKY